jgi:hypothetical protein
VSGFNIIGVAAAETFIVPQRLGLQRLAPAVQLAHQLRGQQVRLVAMRAIRAASMELRQPPQVHGVADGLGLARALKDGFHRAGIQSGTVLRVRGWRTVKKPAAAGQRRSGGLTFGYLINVVY